MVFWFLIADEHFGTRGSLKRFLVMLWARYGFWLKSFLRLAVCWNFLMNIDQLLAYSFCFATFRNSKAMCSKSPEVVTSKDFQWSKECWPLAVFVSCCTEVLPFKNSSVLFYYKYVGTISPKHSFISCSIFGYGYGLEILWVTPLCVTSYIFV